MLEKENAVEVIDLVAESTRKKIFAANLVGLAFGVLGLNSDKLRTDDVPAEAGDREAAFFFADFPFRMNDFGLFEDGVAKFDDRINLALLGRRLRGGDRGGFRTRRFVGHSCRNSAASRRGCLPQIFAEKHWLTEGR